MSGAVSLVRCHHFPIEMAYFWGYHIFWQVRLVQHLALQKKHIPIDFHILKGCGEPPPSSQFSGFFLIWFKMIRKNCCKRISLINFSPPKIGVNFDQFSLRAGRVVSRRPWNHWGFSKSCPFIPPKMMDLEEVSVDGRASTELLSDCWFAGGVNMSV